MSKPEPRNRLALIPAFIEGLFTDLRLFFPEMEKTLTLDRDYILLRFKCEGIKFLTFTLAKAGKAIEASLITNHPLVIEGLPLMDGSLPKLCHRLYQELFDKEGLPLSISYDDAVMARRANVLRALRQVFLMCSKLKTTQALQSDEASIEAFTKRVTRPSALSLPNYIIRGAYKLISDVVMDDGRLAAPLYQWHVDPFGRHGPGAVAGKEIGVQRWNFLVAKGLNPLLFKWHPTSYIHKKDRMDPSRLQLVPKDFRSKRIICIEPKEHQFGQQGLMDVLYHLIMDDCVAGQSIDFLDQRKNYYLSRRPDMATIDLKDASDTIHMDLCRLLLPKEFFSLITRYRSRSVTLPNGNVIQPTCFASMGSALCFPIETLVFWALARATLDHYHRQGPLRVFGDDIIVPNSGYEVVCRTLRQAGLIINTEKSCYKTPVRESCGSWWYDRFDCRYVKLYNTTASDYKSWSALLEAANQLIESYHLNAAQAILAEVSNFCGIDPSYREIFPGNGEIRYAPSRWNSDLQRYECQIPVALAGTGRSPLPDDQALYAWVVGNDTRPSHWRKPDNGDYKMRWVLWSKYNT